MLCFVVTFFVEIDVDHRDLHLLTHSFPTRRSSDLDEGWDELTIAEALPDYDAAFIGKWHVGGFGVKGYQPSDNGFEELVYWDAPGSRYFDWKPAWGNHFDYDRKNQSKNAGLQKRPQSDFVTGNIGIETNEEYLTDDLTEQAVHYIKERANGGKPFFLYFCHFAVHGPWQGKPEDIAYFDKKPTKGWNGHRSEERRVGKEGVSTCRF